MLKQAALIALLGVSASAMAGRMASESWCFCNRAYSRF